MRFKIWSNEHNAWWRPDGWGYTEREEQAGWFSGYEAFKVLYKSHFGSAPGKPNEVLVDGDGRRLVLVPEVEG